MPFGELYRFLGERERYGSLIRMELFHVFTETEWKHLHLESRIDSLFNRDRIDKGFPKLPPKFLVLRVFGRKRIKIEIVCRHQGTALIDLVNEHAAADGIHNDPVLSGKAV